MNSKLSGINDNSNSSTIKNVMLAGFVIRLSALLFMLFFAVSWTEPYFISDDILYERMAGLYLDNAHRLVDFSAFSRLPGGFLQPFWPWVMCISAYLFGSIYASRFINIILSTLCIRQVYKITLNISNNEETALTAAKLFAFLPVTVLTCCFPIKDIFLTFAVLYCFNVFVELQSGEKITAIKVIFCAALLAGIYFTRGAVTELMLIFLAVYIIQRFVKARNYPAVIAMLVIFCAAAYLMKNSVLQAFERKIDDYGEYSLIGDSASFNAANVLKQLIKLPFVYFFATLQPVKLGFSQFDDTSWWLNIISYLNISIYPIAIGNFLYIFSKKKNLFFWLSSLIMYCAIIFMVLGVFRHYLFLIPIEMINFSLYKEESESMDKVCMATPILLMAVHLFTAFVM